MSKSVSSGTLQDKSTGRALLSVSDKTGLVEFAQGLVALGIELLSTGGTAALLREHKIPVRDVSELTEFPEIMDGRVKTLHPKIHGGILARRGIDDAVLSEHAIETIDIVAVNLYPFKTTIAKGCTLEEAIENIDIGGPSMIRGAAKNYAHVTVVVDPQDYVELLNELHAHGCIPQQTRFKFAAKAFAHTADYDAAISNYLMGENFPKTYTKQWIKHQDLRYGENPHQEAAFYYDPEITEASVSMAKQLQGKQLSYNNIADSDAALECVKQFSDIAACVIVKHANPCGVALAKTQLHAYQRAYATDPSSAFGGIIAFNTTLEPETALMILEQQFVEVLIAPSIHPKAAKILASKPNVRVLSTGTWTDCKKHLESKYVLGGLLLQERDLMPLKPEDLKLVTKRHASVEEIRDCLFAWNVAKFVKSNAIVYAKDQATIGIGAGQMSRVMSSKIAALKAEEVGFNVSGVVMASDAFFPFRDGIDTAAKAGITAVIQPGGSMRDEEVIAAADEAGMAMLFTDIRHFRH